MSQKSKDPSTGNCIEVECKAKHERLNFCSEHYEQFKFGCIRRDGLRPTDYQKKFHDYQQYRARLK